MSSAPLSQTLLVTNDSVFSQPSSAVTIPIGPIASITNTLGISSLLGTAVTGFAQPANALATRLTALGA